MTQVFEVDPVRLDQAGAALGAAAEAVAAGLLVVLPTETVYGIACRPDVAAATDRLFTAKRRPPDLALPVLTPSVEGAWNVADPNHAARALAAAFWPGPLTMVLPRTERSRPWNLGASSPHTIAVRVPDHPLCLELMARTGHLAASSANVSGSPPLSTRDALKKAFGDDVAVYVMLTSAWSGSVASPSTVVDLTDASIRILREGSISLDGIRRIIDSE